MEIDIWTLIATALVLFMTPGLAFFYGGLVKSSSVVSMMMLSFGAFGLVAVLWLLYGFNMGGISESGFGNLVGNPFSDFGLFDMVDEDPGAFATVAFGGSFAIITVALISGAVADRAKFWPWMLFAGLWATIVYFPGNAWVWAVNEAGDYIGWIGGGAFGWNGAYDWAGGTIVHQASGAAAFALALVLGRRTGFSKDLAVSHNVPLVLIGAAILWFGWFGFNVGVFDDYSGGALIFVNTVAAPAAGLLGWIIVEKLRDGKSTAVGAASGIIAGLVAITPACAHVAPFWALVLGLLAGVVCAYAVDLKWKLGFDDSLDVVGIHLVAGFIGCIYIGFLGQYDGAEKTDFGLFFGGGASQLWAQFYTSAGMIIFSFVVAYIIGTVIDKTIGFRVKEDEEIAGLDSSLHGGGYAID